MKRKSLLVLIAAEAAMLALVLGWAVYRAARRDVPAAAVTTAPAETAPPTTLPETAPATEPTVPTTVPETEPETEPQPEIFTLSFAGDCTLGNLAGDNGSAESFLGVVGDRYDYPFAGVRALFEADDFTLVNLEGVLTDLTQPADPEKEFCFRGPPSYAAILTAGSVEGVTLSNNHTYDYGAQGYADTEKALSDAGVAYAGTDETFLFTTESGLTVGVYANSFWMDTDHMAARIAALREAGAEVVIASFHWGQELSYAPSGDQIHYAHAAVDAGADIVFGHHPHVLQEIETYGSGVIFYSLGNFSFGGNGNPRDKDTAVLQQEIIRDPDGTVRLGTLRRIPCRISGREDRNDFQPTVLAESAPAYARVLSKLEGTYEGS